ncbi:hypothetical protein Tco_0616755, partial [Tanacetum coccineum]
PSGASAHVGLVWVCGDGRGNGGDCTSRGGYGICVSGDNQGDNRDAGGDD